MQCLQTKIVHIDSLDCDASRDAILEAGAIIRQGGLVVFPTETVYGLGGDATNEKAAFKIYKAKGRPSDNPLIIHVASPEDAEKYAVTCPLYDRLADALMPGPLTVILPVRSVIPKTVTASLPTVAVRCPEHPIAQALIRAAGVPIAAPSANLSGSPSPTCGAHVIADMNGRVDMILDGGASDVGVESTIVKIVDEKTLLLLRPGGITVEDLQKCGCTVLIADAVTEALKEGEQVLSPGMKYKHYAPKAPLTLLAGTSDSRMTYLKQRVFELRAEGKRCAVIAYREECDLLRLSFPDTPILDFGSQSDEKEQARLLFARLRETDVLSIDEIYAPLPRLQGMGLALYNRMIRAAAHQILHT